MEHFSDHAWADFARGLNASEKARGIQAHIASGCLNCKTTGRFWSRIGAMAMAERAYAVPENLVRMAKLEFTAKQELAQDWIEANPVFDTLSSPVLAGARGGDAIARHVVYEAEGLTMHLQFDRGPQPGKVFVVGQILDTRIPGDVLTGAPIVVWAKNGQLVASTIANSHGEFQVEFDAGDELRVTARVGGRRVRVPLMNLK
jgi:hypothetical protein